MQSHRRTFLDRKNPCVLLFLKPSALAILEVFPNEKAKCIR